jgi:hypothetical protein
VRRMGKQNGQSHCVKRLRERAGVSWIGEYNQAKIVRILLHWYLLRYQKTFPPGNSKWYNWDTMSPGQPGKLKALEVGGVDTSNPAALVLSIRRGGIQLSPAAARAADALARGHLVTQKQKKTRPPPPPSNHQKFVHPRTYIRENRTSIFVHPFCSWGAVMLAVARPAVPSVPAPGLPQGYRRITVATIQDRFHAHNGRVVRLSGHQLCHGDSNFAGKDSYPISKHWKTLGGRGTQCGSSGLGRRQTRTEQ